MTPPQRCDRGPTRSCRQRRGRRRGEASAGSAPLCVDRLALDPKRLEAVAHGLEDIAALPDPVGRVLAEWTRPNGLDIARVSVPLGVIGIIYESRPNVTADAGGLAVKSGNAAILRGGSESFHSSRALVAALRDGLRAAGLPEDAIQLVPTRDRAAVGMMLKMSGVIDIIVPRGGRSLIERVQRESRIPVIAHLEGLCHTYVDGAADPEKARAIVLNAKMRRVSICGATETLLVDRAVAATMLPPILADLRAAGCELRGDPELLAIDPAAVPATEEDWRTEYLDAILAVRVVDGVGGRDRAHQPLRLAPHRRDRHRGRGAPPSASSRSRQRDRPGQRLDPVRRWRRIRHGRRDRHLDPAPAAARPGRRRRADDLQIPRARHRPGAPLNGTHRQAPLPAPREREGPSRSDGRVRGRRIARPLTPTLSPGGEGSFGGAAGAASACSAARSIRRMAGICISAGWR